MRFFGFFLLCWTASLPVRAEEPADSLSVVDLAEVEVKGVRASKAAPFAVSEVNGQDLDGFSKTGRELPFLFSRTPGVLAWSENGMGTGTTYLRVRGSDDTHVNVTLDGIPLNSPEDQRVFWANMNSYASLLGNVQIQRGVGTSSNGDGAFGSTVAMSSRFPSLKPSAEITGSWGSYGTWRAGGNFSTGLLARHWVMDGAYHETSTNGYVHGTAGRQGSYYGGLAYLGDNFMIRYKNFGNFEKTGQAWNGVTAGSNDLSLMDGTYGMKTGVRTYKDLFDAGLGRYNSLTECLLTDEDGNFIQDADGNYQTGRYRMRDGSYWKKTTDNFYQNHNLLSMAWNFRKGWTLHGGLHYTYGYGYYTEFRPDNKLKKFGISNYTLSDGTTLKRTDFVRKKGLTQHTYGMVWDVSYTGKRWDFIGGMSLGQFEGNHFGRLTYIANEELSAALLKDGAYDYYHSNAYKKDDNAFAKATWHISGKWDAFADVQFRHVRYKTNGINDKFYEEGSRYYNQQLDVNACYNFLNPKAGVTFHHGGHRAYASVAVGHREPARNNFTDNGSYPAPEAERLTDWEVGYQWTDGTWSLSAGAYFMDYTDQLVQTGEVSDIGEALTTNIKDSYPYSAPGLSNKPFHSQDETPLGFLDLRC